MIADRAPPRRDARSMDRKALEEIRRRAAARVQAGESPEAVIRALGMARACLYNWRSPYRAGGQSPGARTPADRPPPPLNHTITMKSPPQPQFPFALGTRALMAKLIRDRLGVKLSVRSVGRRPARLGWTCQRPMFAAYEQNSSLGGARTGPRIPAPSRAGPPTRGGNLFWGRGGRPLRLPCRHDRGARRGRPPL